MVAGKKYDCLSADIWSCGIILFAMLCGYLPFEDPDTAKLYKKIISGSYEIPSFISASSKFIIQKILNTNPEARYSIEEIRASDWYNQNPKRYIEKGTILSRNPLEINEQIILLMERRSIDPKVVRGFITSNRHNSITAHYYLLKKKVEKDPNILLQLQDKPKNIIVRN
jgi:5'-AMP-activated protein kinase catalytic alpha subunit